MRAEWEEVKKRERKSKKERAIVVVKGELNAIDELLRERERKKIEREKDEVGLVLNEE